MLTYDRCHLPLLDHLEYLPSPTRSCISMGMKTINMKYTELYSVDQVQSFLMADHFLKPFWKLLVSPRERLLIISCQLCRSPNVSFLKIAKKAVSSIYKKISDDTAVNDLPMMKRKTYLDGMEIIFALMRGFVFIESVD